MEKLTIVDETNELQFEDDEEEQTQAHELPDYACKYCGLHDPVCHRRLCCKHFTVVSDDDTVPFGQMSFS